jgi:hypothetical protein
MIGEVTDIAPSNLPNVTSIDRIYKSFEINYKIIRVPLLTDTPQTKAKPPYNFTTQKDLISLQKRH